MQASTTTIINHRANREDKEREYLSRTLPRYMRCLFIVDSGTSNFPSLSLKANRLLVSSLP